MFEYVKGLPDDPILQIIDCFRNDLNPQKIDLGVGVYQDETGNTPILAAVKEAEKHILATQCTKAYLGIAGDPKLASCVHSLLFGNDHELVVNDRLRTVQTPGGTAALRVAGDFINKISPQATVWLSKPSWPNHLPIFTAAGLAIKYYRYYHEQQHVVDFDAMLQDLQQVKPGDVLLLHGCCHNPTGADLTANQLQLIADFANKRQLMPFVDLAYLGFADGLEQDTRALQILADSCREFMVATSFSKNFSLYNERIGSLTIVAGNSKQANNAGSVIKSCIRGNYSMPPNHGAAIVITILQSSQLNLLWQEQLATFRERIKSLRALFVDQMASIYPQFDFSFINRQKGMFSLLGINNALVNKIITEHSVYMVSDSRINLTGLHSSNIEYFCQALGSVLAV